MIATLKYKYQKMLHKNIFKYQKMLHKKIMASLFERLLFLQKMHILFFIKYIETANYEHRNINKR